VSTDTLALARVPGFESTHYALLDGYIVWTGETAHSDHPRNLANPWQAGPAHYQAAALREGAALAWQVLQTQTRPSLLAWLGGEALPFPLNLAEPRLHDLAQAINSQNLAAFEAACMRLLGWGVGLTPSGDDLVGAVFFTLRHAPIADWKIAMPSLGNRISHAAQSASNPISAALLNDLLQGSSYRALHELFDALHAQQTPAVEDAMHALLRIGASSGSDMLAGVLLTLLNPELPAKRL
jgi:Protein of unknown function (DUF2877)